MNNSKIKDGIKKCNHCKSAISSDAYNMFPLPTGDELFSIQAAHAEEMLKFYRRLEGDCQVDIVCEETIATSIAALLDLALQNKLSMMEIAQKVVEAISIDSIRSGL